MTADTKTAAPAPKARNKSFNEETVLSVHHWTESLFSFTTTRAASFRFDSGQFAMIGLEVDGRPLTRAYSIASPSWEDTLEFFSIKVPNGPLTSRLQHIKVGETMLVGRKPTGTLVLDNLCPGRTLYLFATGTGLAPFLGIVKEPDTYDRFDRVVLTHTCRTVDELAYAQLLTHDLPQHEFLGDLLRDKLIYYPTVTREPFHTTGRITDLIRSGKMAADLSLPALDPTNDRAMICGGPEMLAESKLLLEQLGFQEGNMSNPAQFVVEKAFVER